MQVASKDLCAELYELSGWGNEDDITNFYDASEFKNLDFQKLLVMHNRNCPAYDLGYLLRKLPRSIKDEFDVNYSLRMILPVNDWRYDYYSSISSRLHFSLNDDAIGIADSPEDALCKLAILLFKRGVITRDA